MRGALAAALPPLLLLRLQGCQGPTPQEEVCQGVLTNYCSEWDSFLAEPPIDERKQRTKPVFDRECKQFMGGDRWDFSRSTLWPMCLGCAGSGTPEAEVQRCLFDAAVKPPDTGVARQVCAQNIRTYCEQWKQELDRLGPAGAAGNEAAPVFDTECAPFLGGSEDAFMGSPLWAKCLPCSHLVAADAEHCLVAAAKAPSRPGDPPLGAGIVRPQSKDRRLWGDKEIPTCEGAFQGIVPSPEMDNFFRISSPERCKGYVKSRHPPSTTDGDNIPLDGRCFMIGMLPPEDVQADGRAGLPQGKRPLTPDKTCQPLIKGTSPTPGETGLKYEAPLFTECECGKTSGGWGRAEQAEAEQVIRNTIGNTSAYQPPADNSAQPVLGPPASLLDASEGRARRFPARLDDVTAASVGADGETAEAPPLARRNDAEARRHE